MLKTVVESILNLIEKKDMEINPESQLINDLGLDSLQLVTILLDLEDKLDLYLDYEELDFDEIVTVGNLVSYLEEQE